MTTGSRSIEIDVGRDAVWRLLVGEGRHDWYYRLSPQGEFAAGSHVKWFDIQGNIAEESEVIEVEPPARLVLKTRFMFAPAFAAATPHAITWELAEHGGRCHVTMRWDAEAPAERLLASEADAQLQGLRLAADPVARAGLQRLDSIGPIEVRMVTPERASDYLEFFDNHAFRDFPEWQSCYCIETHRTEDDDQWAARTAGDNRREMYESIKRGSVTGLLAYEGDKPIGWCNYGETIRLAGMVRKLNLDLTDHDGVGSVACFVIAAPYRGHGVASMLLDSAIDNLRVRGAKAVEGYPRRSEDSPQSNYRGPLAMFLRAGFEPYHEAGSHLILRKSLA